MNPTQSHDTSRAPVAEVDVVSGLRIALITFGIGTTLPVFWLGAQVVAAVGVTAAVAIFVTVCALAGVLSVFTGLVGNRSRLSTYMVLRFSFGRTGALVINALVALMLVGFYAATLDVFGKTIHDALAHYLDPGQQPSVAACTLTGSLMMTLTGVIGFKGIDRLSMASVPLMALFIVYVIGLTFRAAPTAMPVHAVPSLKSLVDAISSVVGMVVLTPVLMPDISRYARRDGDSVLGSLGLALGFPLVLLAGGLPVIVTGQSDIVAVMQAFDIVLPAMFILVFSSWITNTANLYSAGLTLATLFETREGMLTAAASVLGTLLALGGFMGYFEDFLSVLSLIVPPVASIYLVDFFWIRRQRYHLEDLAHQSAWGFPALGAWLAASAVAAASGFGLMHLSGLPALDGLLVAAVLYALLCRRRRNIF